MANGFADAAHAKRLRFRELLKRPGVTVMPGGFSPLYARLAQMAGFECFFLAGSQLSAFLYGVPDNGIVGLRDLVDHARHLAAHADIPVLIDCDTGFGNAVNAYYAVQECVRAGVAALQIEDQEAPKKSATVAGRRCISIDEAVGKIKAAVAARDELDPAFAICARCDILGAEGSNFREAVERCARYINEGGADLVWLNSVETRDDVRRACAEIPGPVLAIWGGKDAAPTVEEYGALGVKIALYPVIAATAGLQASWQVLNDFRERGTAALQEWDAANRRSKWGRVDFGALVGQDKIREIEERFLPENKKRDYDTTWGHKTTFATEDDKPKGSKP